MVDENQPKPGTSRSAPSNSTFNGADSILRIPPPEQFSFKHEEWPRWLRRYNRFSSASGMDQIADENKINNLLLFMGPKAEDIFDSLLLTEEERKIYPKVLEKFENYFTSHRNIIYERAIFNRRVQLPNESVSDFITSLHKLASTCKFQSLEGELIRDRIVVGISDSRLSETLQLDKDLTLTKAIEMCRQREDVRKQQENLRSGNSHIETVQVDVNRVNYNRYKKSNVRHKSKKKTSSCFWCGSQKLHGKDQCPARNSTCNICKIKGHFAKVCRRSNGGKNVTVQNISDVTVRDLSETFFIGRVNNKTEPWTVSVFVNGTMTRFKIDSGADITLIPFDIYKKLKCDKLEKVVASVRGPTKERIDIIGKFSATVEWESKTSVEDIYVVTSLADPLLGRPAIEHLNILKWVNNISKNPTPFEDEIHSRYKNLFTGIGKIKQVYSIKIKSDATPFAISMPRRTPLPLKEKIKCELERMLDTGVISRITEPTDWCAGIVPVFKKNSNSIRICVDYTKLNSWICRERAQLPSVEETLGQIGGAAYFSKLDASSGFWQIPLDDSSKKYTTFITDFGRFVFNRLPFGITSAPEKFQMIISDTLRGMKGVVCLMDDILVFGNTIEEHDQNLHRVLQKLEKDGFTLNPLKCELRCTKIKFLGYIVSRDGISPDPDKIAAVLRLDKPKNIQELRSFLGIVNYNIKFLPHLATVSQPLRVLLQNDKNWTWEESQEKAFLQIKSLLSQPPILAFYDVSRLTRVSADASSYGLGAVLEQFNGSHWKPVAFSSRSLSTSVEAT